MRYTLTRDDMPLLSQWIKKFDKSKLVEFFGSGTRIVYSDASSSAKLRLRRGWNANPIPLRFASGAGHGKLVPPPNDKKPPSWVACHLAAELGFEPRHTESESAVLPLHNSAMLLRRDYLPNRSGDYFNTSREFCQGGFIIFSKKVGFILS